MSLPYACATVSARDTFVLRTCAHCLYLKNDVAHGLIISKNTPYVTPLKGAMQRQTHAIMLVGPISISSKGGL